jgi:hypothetical protein
VILHHIEKLIKMKNFVICLLAIFSLIGCEKEKNKTKIDLSNINGYIEIHRCFCSSSAYRYLIVTINDNDTIYYNPINLSDDYKDFNYKVIFSAELLNDSSIVYTNTASDALIEDFKVRNIKIANINRYSDFVMNDTLKMDYGITYNDYKDMISIGVDTVLEDSRCPSGVMCAWEGNAEVRFDFIQNKKSTKFSLNTANSFRKDTLIAGYKIHMIRVVPYPVYPDFIKQKDYKAIVKITK